MASAVVPKPSFAKVAATSISTTNQRRAPGNADATVTKETAMASSTPTTKTSGGKASAKVAKPPKLTSQSPSPETAQQGDIIEGVSKLAVSTPPNPAVNVNGSSLSINAKSATADSDDSHRTDSSDLGTKPPSLDGKSITSGTTTTFALDEKDSLRPDDSASVQAAADDDDSSVRGSLVAASHPHQFESCISIDVGLSGDISARVSPASDSSPDPAVAPVSAPANALDNIYQQAPDDKLLEAIESIKDRQFLLRLEIDVINFVQESKEPYMDLPPSNSFFRMLTHKLADYYHMTHSYEKDNGPGFVRIFRTPFCRVPPSLASIAASTKSPTPPPPILPMKIMRRGEDSKSTAPASSSAVQSKAASEVEGPDQKEKADPKERKTREEREEAYNEARKRIFGTSATPVATNTTDNTSENDGENEMSRASSVSTKDKSTTNSRRGKNVKQRRDSGTFESRHNYVQQWSHPQPWGGSQPQPHYVPVGTLYQAQQGPPQHQNQHLAQTHPPYTSHVPPAYANGSGQVAGSIPAAQSYPSHGYVPNGQYPSHTPAGRFPQQGHSTAPYSHGASIPQWQSSPNVKSSQYGRGSMPPNPAMGPNSVHYPFGQLPISMNPYDAKTQHPIPGSYNRPGYNMSNQPFIPDSRAPAPGQPLPPTQAQPPMQPMYPAPPPQHMSPRMDTYGPMHYGPSPQMAYAQPCMASPYAMAPHMPSHVPPPPPMGTYAHQPAPQPHHVYAPSYPHHVPPQSRPPVHQTGTGGKAQRTGTKKRTKPNAGAGAGAGTGGKTAGETSIPPASTPSTVSATNTFSNSSLPAIVDSGAAIAAAAATASKSATTTSATAGQPFGNLPHYGNPATLPQKPT
ncbi:hypothetical protein HOO65_050647 [Ceratocystis lukuohia]|uniref:R3H domain-containing protein 2 n=1 Tax=Ceratocystis lukuohia TaxID=2019550 RepID=A0ABR4MGZ6_9PEZI